MPHEEGPGVPPPTWSLIRDVATEGESIGLSSLWLVDHLLWRGDPWMREASLGISEALPYGVKECWTTLAAVAAVTERIRIGSLVSCTAYRNPVLLAKMADNVDELSGGRLVLGLGAGDYLAEHEMIGVPTDRPVARFEEALSIIVPLLRTGQVDFDGEFYRAREAELRPRRLNTNGPPVMIGSIGHGPRMMRLIAKYADVWNAWALSQTPDQLPALYDAVDSGCHTHGRDPNTLARALGVPVVLGDSPLDWPGVVRGSDQEIAERLSLIAGDRVDEIHVILFPTNAATVSRLGDIIDLMAR